jgi:hypothetical protein
VCTLFRAVAETQIEALPFPCCHFACLPKRVKIYQQPVSFLKELGFQRMFKKFIITILALTVSFEIDDALMLAKPSVVISALKNLKTGGIDYS